MTPSQQACLVICERTGRWARRVRRYAPNVPLTLIETRSDLECKEQLAEHPAALVGLELTQDSIGRTVHFWTALARGFPQASIVALCDDLPNEVHELCRELGGIDVMTSELDSMRFPALLRGYPSRRSSGTLDDDSLRQHVLIRARLPWANVHR